MTPADHTLLPGRLDAAAAAVATAALAPNDPVLLFDVRDLGQVAADEGMRHVAPIGTIAVAPPRHYVDDDHLADLCAHRLRRALLRSGVPSVPFSEIRPLELVDAVSALVAAARRRRCPAEWMALRCADLREVDLNGASVADTALDAGVVWVPLGGLPTTWAEALEVARGRIEAALAAPARPAAPAPARLAA
jgi:hypothetical protein